MEKVKYITDHEINDVSEMVDANYSSRFLQNVSVIYLTLISPYVGVPPYLL